MGAVVLGLVFAGPMARQQGLLGEAAGARWRGEYRETLRLLGEACEAYPENPTACVELARLRLAGAISAAESGQVGEEAIRELLASAAAALRRPERAGVVDQRLMQERVLVDWEGAKLLSGEAGKELRERALAGMAELAKLSPYEMPVQVRWADMLWEAGRREEAAMVYRYCLEDLDPKLYLDEADQLSEAERARIRARLEGGSDDGGTGMSGDGGQVE